MTPQPRRIPRRRPGPLRAALLMLMACGLAGGLASVAAARDFAGRVASVSATTLQVESRMGDRRAFQKGPDTRVSGARKSWGALRAGDSVVVSWSLGDSEPLAHHVRVGSVGGQGSP